MFLWSLQGLVILVCKCRCAPASPCGPSERLIGPLAFDEPLMSEVQAGTHVHGGSLSCLHAVPPRLNQMLHHIDAAHSSSFKLHSVFVMCVRKGHCSRTTRMLHTLHWWKSDRIMDLEEGPRFGVQHGPGLSLNVCIGSPHSGWPCWRGLLWPCFTVCHEEALVDVGIRMSRSCSGSAAVAAGCALAVCREA